MGLHSQDLIPEGAKDVFLEDLSLIHNIQTSSGALLVGTRGSFHRSKMARV
jgi:hypothetical protein